MEYLKEFNEMMANTKDIALATSVNNVPNVRIVNFYYDPRKPGVVYFTSVKGKPKEYEFLQNNQVAFTTVPVGTSAHVRVRNATVHKSSLSIHDLKNAFIDKISTYKIIIAQLGDKIDLYEIHFSEANVISGVNNQGKVTF